MEIFQQCLTEALKFIILAFIAGAGILARKYLVPLMREWIDKIQKMSEKAGLQLTDAQLDTARGLIRDLVSSAYRLKLGDKIDDAKQYVNDMAKTELGKLGIELSDELIDELRRAALGQLELTIEAIKEPEEPVEPEN
nr:MAG TPA: holin [Caudoviricetes sp.]